MTEQDRIRTVLNQLLWQQWDPIGVNHVEEVRDEYRHYVPGLLALKQQGAAAETLAAHLLDIETRTMGPPGDVARCQHVAARLFAI